MCGPEPRIPSAKSPATREVSTKCRRAYARVDIGHALFPDPSRPRDPSLRLSERLSRSIIIARYLFSLSNVIAARRIEPHVCINFLYDKSTKLDFRTRGDTTRSESLNSIIDCSTRTSPPPRGEEIPLEEQERRFRSAVGRKLVNIFLASFSDVIPLTIRSRGIELSSIPRERLSQMRR